MKIGKAAIVANNALLAKPRKSGPHHPATIRSCTCSNPFQDLQYGFMRRVHNNRMLGKDLIHSCTSCGKGSRPQARGFKFPINPH